MKKMYAKRYECLLLLLFMGLFLWSNCHHDKEQGTHTSTAKALKKEATSNTFVATYKADELGRLVAEKACKCKKRYGEDEEEFRKCYDEMGEELQLMEYLQQFSAADLAIYDEVNFKIFKECK